MKSAEVYVTRFGAKLKQKDERTQRYQFPQGKVPHSFVTTYKLL